VSTLRRQYDESRAVLGDHLRLYQIHSATVDSGVLEDAAVLEALAALRAGGLSIGLTVTGTGQPDTIRRALEVGGFDAVQATWNVLEQSAGPALAEAHEAGLSVIVKEAVANGRLTSRGDTPLLRQAAARAGVSPDALALAAVLAQPWVDVALSGAVSTEMLTSNLQAREIDVDDDLLDRLAPLREDPETYWATRSELSWN
jgi:aryl-alcohol dehydrogenase-like predicted oxidoreductase